MSLAATFRMPRYEEGWRLAPMFDVNPNPDGGASALDRGDLIADADYYRLTKAEAARRYEEIERVLV